ncbi:hypothetical protein Pelo_5352 [Pelomyxa schiedti]|nr:hypothetical protein Pelo_5352 [Pelomyxa schiedti]
MSSPTATSTSSSSPTGPISGTTSTSTNVSASGGALTASEVLLVLSRLNQDAVKQSMSVRDGNLVVQLPGKYDTVVNVGPLLSHMPTHLMFYMLNHPQPPYEQMLMYVARGLAVLFWFCALAHEEPFLFSTMSQEKYLQQVADLIMLTLLNSLHSIASAVDKPMQVAGAMVRSSFACIPLCFVIVKAFLEWELPMAQNGRSAKTHFLAALMAPERANWFIETMIDCVVQVDRNTEHRTQVSRLIMALFESLTFLSLGSQFIDALSQHPRFLSGEFLSVCHSALCPSQSVSSPPVDLSSSQVPHNSLKVLLNIFSAQSPCILDLIAESPQASQQMALIIKFLFDIVSQTRKENLWELDIVVEVFRVIEVLSDDSNFKIEMIKCGTEPLLALMSTDTTEFSAHLRGSTSSNNNPRRVGVLLFRIIGSLHWSDQKGTSPETQGQFIGKVVELLTSSQQSLINAANVRSNLELLSAFMHEHSRDPIDIGSTTPAPNHVDEQSQEDDLQYFTTFMGALKTNLS